MISVLIFSFNRVESVVKLAERVREYVDEVVIVDSSDVDKHEELKRRLPFARIYWLPPLGMVELYYKVGLDLCKGEYVLHLEDDEEPSEELLRDLRKIVKRGYVFGVWRKSPREVYYLFRLFHRDYIVPTGYIHLTWASKVPPVVLEDKYHIIHKEYFAILRHLRTVFESWQYGAKVLYVATSPHYLIWKRRKRIPHIFPALAKFGTLGWFIFGHIHILNRALRYLLKDPFWAFYLLFSQLRFFRDFPRNVWGWMLMYRLGVCSRFG